MNTKIHISKWHGLGNDFIVVDAIKQPLPLVDLSGYAKKWCHRNTGIGADGLCVLYPSSTAVFKMIIINADGTEAEMCGNLIRCLGAFAREYGYTDKHIFDIETAVGNLTIEIISEEKKETLVKVNMGRPILEEALIPAHFESIKNPVVEEPVIVNGTRYRVTPVSMGNPHGVIFVETLADIPFLEHGPLLETHKVFPEKANIEFVETVSTSYVKVDVWERGVGRTQACGTGACAVVVAGRLSHRLDAVVDVELPGGVLTIEWQGDDAPIMMTGPAVHVFDAEMML